MKTTLFSTLLLFFSIYSFGQNSKPKIELLNYPQLNLDIENELGSSLVYSEKKETYKGFHVDEAIIQKQLINKYILKPTDIYLFNIEKDYDYYMCIDDCIEIYDKNGTTLKKKSFGGLKISKGFRYFSVFTLTPSGFFNLKNLEDDPKLTPKEVSLIKSLKFKKEFIYNGKVGNAIKFIYREFIEDMARPSFTQEVQYDIEESKIIGFKGMKIEILNATNSLIKYKVISHFPEY